MAPTSGPSRHGPRIPLVLRRALLQKTMNLHVAALDYGSVASVRDNSANATGWETGTAAIVSVSHWRDYLPGPDGVFASGEKVRMVIRAKANQALRSPILGFLIRDRLGQDLLWREHPALYRHVAPTCSTRPAL